MNILLLKSACAHTGAHAHVRTHTLSHAPCAHTPPPHLGARALQQDLGEAK